MDGLNGAGFSSRHFLRTGSQTNDGGAGLTPDFTLNVEFIPEPASVLLFGLGLVWCLYCSTPLSHGLVKTCSYPKGFQ